MTIDDIIDYVRALGDVLVLRPQEGDGSPEIAWGDAFFYFAPDGVVPKTQPFATIVTKDYPDDSTSQLNRSAETFRVNIAAGTAEFRTWTGHGPKESPTLNVDPSAADTVIPHPVYGNLGWLAVVNPGPRTTVTIEELLEAAHHHARERFNRRADLATGDTR